MCRVCFVDCQMQLPQPRACTASAFQETREWNEGRKKQQARATHSPVQSIMQPCLHSFETIALFCSSQQHSWVFTIMQVLRKVVCTLQALSSSRHHHGMHWYLYPSANNSCTNLCTPQRAYASIPFKKIPIMILLCRSTSRLSSGQRVALNDVEEAHIEDREGQPYWVFEHLSQVCFD